MRVFINLIAATGFAAMPLLHSAEAMYNNWVNDNLAFVLANSLPLPVPCRAPWEKDDEHNVMQGMSRHAQRNDDCTLPKFAGVLERNGDGMPELG